jgi:hypothetical protein
MLPGRSRKLGQAAGSENKLVSVARQAGIDIGLLAEMSQHGIEPTGIAAYDLRTAMRKNGLPDICFLAPVQLRSHRGVADQGSGPPPNQGRAQFRNDVACPRQVS